MLDIVCGVVDFMLPKLMDDDDEDEFRRQHPYTHDNAKQRFLYEWLPSHFGNPTVPGLDGKQHPLADVLRNGVPSELLGVNFASRLGWNGMWLRESQPGDDWKEGLINFIETNFSPGASISLEFVNALQDIYKGDILRGMEKVLPGMVRGAASSYRLATQGGDTRKGDKMFTKDEFTAFQRAMQVLGWQPNELADWQREKYVASSIIQEVGNERTDLMRSWNKALSDPEGDADTVKKAEDDIAEFNRTHPLSKLQIEDKDLNASRKAYLKGELKTYRGLKLTDEEAAYFLKYKQ